VTLHATGHNASIDVFENHLVITRFGRGMFFPGPENEQFIPLSSIKSVNFTRPALGARGRIVLILAGGAGVNAGAAANENTVFFSREQSALFEAVLNAIREAIATPSLERLAIEAQRHRNGRGPQISPERLRDGYGANHHGGHARGAHASSVLPSRIEAQSRYVGARRSGWWGELPLPVKISIVSAGLVAFAVMLPGIGGDSHGGMTTEASENSAVGADRMLNASSPEIDEPVKAPTEAQLNPGWLTGSWILTPKGGEDGRTRCEDFSVESIYRLNDSTAKIMTFQSDGSYRDMFAYTTPSGEEHYTLTTATWRADGNAIELNSTTARDAFEVNGNGPTVIKAEASQRNVLVLDGAPRQRFVRCIGSTADIYGE